MQSTTTTRILDGTKADELNLAAQLLTEGALVAIPTETVYGLSASIAHPTAIERVYDVKARDRSRALAVLVSSWDIAKDMWQDGPWLTPASQLAERFWPGPLTILCPSKDHVDLTLRGGTPNMGARCPDHPIALALLQRVGTPLATPSANLSGKPSATSADDVLAQLDGTIEAIVDGGQSPGGLESTIISLTEAGAVLVRAGAIGADRLQEALPSGWTIDASATIKASHKRLIPGTASHPISIEIYLQGQWQVFERKTVDELIHDLHGILRVYGKGERSGAAWRAGDTLRNDPRFDGVCYLINRYLRHT